MAFKKTGAFGRQGEHFSSEWNLENNGSRSSLIYADEKTIQLWYIDPTFTLPERQASTDLPSLEGGRGYSTDENFPWIHTNVKIEPDTNMWEQVETVIARHLYRAIRENAPFPVVNAEALEVAMITEQVKRQNPQFNWAK
ncbi:MAG TPA: hypothetical protein VHV83_14505 [Armatimonadota bacterium]|nr:hypothetical protein [Armatimonadota bacterium]